MEFFHIPNSFFLQLLEIILSLKIVCAQVPIAPTLTRSLIKILFQSGLNFAKISKIMTEDSTSRYRSLNTPVPITVTGVPVHTKVIKYYLGRL